MLYWKSLKRLQKYLRHFWLKLYKLYYHLVHTTTISTARKGGGNYDALQLEGRPTSRRRFWALITTHSTSLQIGNICNLSLDTALQISSQSQVRTLRWLLSIYQYFWRYFHYALLHPSIPLKFWHRH